MAILPLVIAPDPRLKIKSAPVEAVDDSVRALLNDMLETMYALRGVGLAAVQVGVHKRLLVADVEWRDDADERGGKPYKMVNPEIVEHSQEPNVYMEGCLSFPDQYAEVERPKQVKIRYTDENGKLQEIFADGLLATCIQHEIDHLNGIVFVDHISTARKDMILRKLKKAKKLAEDDHHHVHGEHCNH